MKTTGFIITATLFLLFANVNVYGQNGQITPKMLQEAKQKRQNLEKEIKKLSDENLKSDEQSNATNDLDHAESHSLKAAQNANNDNLENASNYATSAFDGSGRDGDNLDGNTVVNEKKPRLNDTQIKTIKEDIQNYITALNNYRVAADAFVKSSKYDNDKAGQMGHYNRTIQTLGKRITLNKDVNTQLRNTISKATNAVYECTLPTTSTQKKEEYITEINNDLETLKQHISCDDCFLNKNN